MRPPHPHRPDDNDEAPAATRPSKTQLKKEMHDLQALGEELVEISDDRLAALALHEAEQWRSELIAGDAALTAWTTRHPGTDLQQLRSLIRAARTVCSSAAREKSEVLALPRRWPI